MMAHITQRQAPAEALLVLLLASKLVQICSDLTITSAAVSFIGTTAARDAGKGVGGREAGYALR